LGVAVALVVTVVEALGVFVGVSDGVAVGAVPVGDGVGVRVGKGLAAPHPASQTSLALNTEFGQLAAAQNVTQLATDPSTQKPAGQPVPKHAQQAAAAGLATGGSDEAAPTPRTIANSHAARPYFPERLPARGMLYSIAPPPPLGDSLITRD
jgi:hypothetical protein